MGIGKDGKGAMLREHRSQALSTLANTVGIFVGTKLAIAEDFRMLKAEVAAGIDGLAPGEGTGLYLYLVDTDLGLTEVDETIENNGPLSIQDSILEAIAERKVQLVGVFEGGVGDTAGMFRDVMTGAPVLTIKPRWTFGNGKSWNYLVFNRSGSTLTTGATVKINSTTFGVWIR